MMTRLFTFIVFAFLLTSCDNTFLEDMPEQRSLAGNWTSTLLQIDNQTIVFEMDLTLKSDHSFVLHASVLGKQHTRYLEYVFTGTWKSLESTDTFEVTYDADAGIIGYYLDKAISKENYLIRIDDNQLILDSNVDGNQFKLVLEQVD